MVFWLLDFLNAFRTENIIFSLEKWPSNNHSLADIKLIEWIIFLKSVDFQDLKYKPGNISALNLNTFNFLFLPFKPSS